MPRQLPQRPTFASASAGTPGRWTCVTFAAVFALLVAAQSPPAFAQAVTGTILGTVTDNTGAVMPGVTVTVTHVDTDNSRTYVTDSNGEYTAPSIPTGTYRVAAELQGFKSTTLEGIRVGVDQRIRMDVQLEVGAMTESVEIVAQTPLVQ